MGLKRNTVWQAVVACLCFNVVSASDQGASLRASAEDVRYQLSDSEESAGRKSPGPPSSNISDRINDFLIRNASPGPSRVTTPKDPLDLDHSLEHIISQSSLFDNNGSAHMRERSHTLKERREAFISRSQLLRSELRDSSRMLKQYLESSGERNKSVGSEGEIRRRHSGQTSSSESKSTLEIPYAEDEIISPVESPLDLKSSLKVIIPEVIKPTLVRCETSPPQSELLLGGKTVGNGQPRELINKPRSTSTFAKGTKHDFHAALLKHLYDNAGLVCNATLDTWEWATKTTANSIGMEVSQIKGMGIESVIHEGDIDRFRKEVFSNDTATIIHRDYTGDRLVESTVKAIKENDKIKHYIVSIKKISPELERLQKTVNLLTEPIITFDENAQITYANAQAAKFLGQQKLVGQSIDSFVDSARTDLMRSDSSEFTTDIIVGDQNDAAVKHCTIRALSPVDDGGKLYTWVISNNTRQEIDRRKLQQATTERNNIESMMIALFHDLVNVVNGQMGIGDALSKKIIERYEHLNIDDREDVEDLASASHEKICQVACDLYDTLDMCKSDLSVINALSNQGCKLLQVFRTYDALCKGTFAPREVPFKASELFSRIKQIQKRLLGDGFMLNASPSAILLPPLVGDPNLLEHVLDNFIANSKKYAQPGRPVEICLSLKTKKLDDNRAELHIKVEDNGRGISPANIEKIFESGFQVDHESPGAGCGLHMVKMILDSIGGTVAVESTLEKGTCFSVRIPYVFAQEESSEEYDETCLIEKSVLYVEDSKSQQMAVSQLLALKGASCDLASSIQEAHEKLSHKQYDVVILDGTIEHSSDDWQHVLHYIRTNRKSMNHNTPAITHSGDQFYAAESGEELRPGEKDPRGERLWYLPKPVTSNLLYQTICKAITASTQYVPE